MAVFLLVTVAKAAGFNEFGYNYTARIFNGTGSSWCLAEGKPSNCLGIYSPDKLVMKWNAEWDRGNAEGWAHPPYAAWEDNEWNGKVAGGSGEVWHYKIVWVGMVWDLTGEYTFHIQFSGQDFDYPVVLTQSGDTVTGTLTDRYLPAEYSNNVLPLTGTVTGNSFVFKVTYPGPYWGTRTFNGTINTLGALSGSWSDDGTDKDIASGTWTSTGKALLTEGPYWVKGGYRIWDQFETIMDQGVDPNLGPGHMWSAHAIPNGYGSVK
jgi:hypothetical protein